MFFSLKFQEKVQQGGNYPNFVNHQIKFMLISVCPKT